MKAILRSLSTLIECILLNFLFLECLFKKEWTFTDFDLPQTAILPIILPKLIFSICEFVLTLYTSTICHLLLYIMSSLTLRVHCSPWLSYFKTSFVVASSARVRFLRAVKKRFNNHANGENLSIRNYIISLSIYFFLFRLMAMKKIYS